MFLVFVSSLPGFADAELRSAVAVAAVIGALVLAGAVALASSGPRESSGECRPGVHRSLRHRLRNYLHGAAAQLRGAADPWLLAKSIAVTAVMWAVMTLSVFAALKAVGPGGSLVAAGLTVVCIALVMILPSAPGYVGATQLAFVVALKPFDLDASTAVAASVIFQGVVYAVVALLTVWAFGDLRLALRWVRTVR